MVVEIDDGQTNKINFIQFVCPSRSPVRGERARARGGVVGIDDGQTNGINCIQLFVCTPNVCPSTSVVGT